MTRKIVICVTWRRAGEVAEGSGTVSVAVDVSAARVLAGAPAGTDDAGTLEDFEALACIALWPSNASVEGVLLVADDEGRLDDGVAWLVRVPDDDLSVNGARAVPFARRSRAQ